MSKEKYKPCSRCGKGKVMTDESHRSYNAKVDGKQVCADCKVSEIYERFGL